ncbi:unnamed protein product [Vitrella brassicaformis CCMP3155]|uniref:Uncharacterized protein n=1 Tax=Vitrella brassicaformis (strain CCMP3155) TaxID=1169540 RepID=A0A0G4EGN3_VITBC|nr:unnamed protein product [Vitrella brassicaformis CCMP3155]|eukprot:CEL94623.1 unnamed protein product [Vitrella brassicaformis CCMP3155]
MTENDQPVDHDDALDEPSVEPDELSDAPCPPTFLPPLSPRAPPFVDERVLRRTHHAAHARASSTRMFSQLYAERDAIRDAILREREDLRRSSLRHRMDQERRWARRLSSSPFLVDQLADTQRIEESTRLQTALERHHMKQAMDEERRAFTALFRGAVRQADQLERTRRKWLEVRERERQLRILQDLARKERLPRLPLVT